MRLPNAVTQPTVSVLTYNIHKGWAPWRTRVTIAAMREALRAVAPDFVLLQEVRGALFDPERAAREHVPQHRYLAEGAWPYVAYGANRFTVAGHHGNAVLSRFPIVAQRNHDLSAAPRWESRGALEVVVAMGAQRVHLFSLHLGLRRRWRQWQLARLRELVAAVPEGRPVIVGGDFNDWERAACLRFAAPLGLQRVDAGLKRPLRTYPARGWRFGRLDRLYVRGFAVLDAQVLRRAPWSRLSDHLPLLARLAWVA